MKCNSHESRNIIHKIVEKPLYFSTFRAKMNLSEGSHGWHEAACCVCFILAAAYGTTALGGMPAFRGDGQRESIQKTVVMGSTGSRSGQAYPERVGPFCGSL